jgi:hypothetical protein
VLAAFSAVSTGAESKPNFSGIWKLVNSDPAQIVILDQNETDLRVFQFVKDRLGMVRGPIDGRTHSQMVDGHACDFLARWDGDSLLFEIKPGSGDSIGQDWHSQHLMSLGRNGESMSVKRTRVAPRAGAFRETWQKQDPIRAETASTAFDARLKLDDAGAVPSGVEGNFFRGWMGFAFNDAPMAEREYLAIIDKKTPSELREEACASLTKVYERNGIFRKDLPLCKKGDRAFYKKLAEYPDVSVTQRGYARVHVGRDSEGRLMLPVNVAGNDASYVVDTGSFNSLLRRSEAVRLGLKLERLTRRITDGNMSFDASLTIVPALMAGATRIENMPFWVVPDARLDWPGVLGADLLLKLETLRWNASGAAEIGFPAQEKDIRKANLCFWGDAMLTDVSSGASGDMVFFFDTGDNATVFYPRFAAGNLDLVSESGVRGSLKWNGHGARSEQIGLTVPEIPLRIGGFDAKILESGVLLERSHIYNQWHGNIGMDLLNSVRQVTLDLKAMRLTLE